ncbi:MAG: aminotransferase class I/II-fold pyridoxal phosphate-dependent enzyme [Thermoplasmata archaeon]
MPVYSWPRRSYSPSETLLSLPNVRLSPFFRPAANGAVCTLCHRECRLYEGAVGACGMRFSHRERIYTAAYGLLSAAESRPMEIKPMYHFYPGTSALTISSWGCNFPCAWCQNWHLSKTAIWQGYFVPEEKVVAWAEKNGDAGINVSFNEPTLLGEYIIEVFKIARARGLHTSINTNGYFTEEVLRRFVDAGIEGMNIDIKGGKGTYEHWLCAKFSRLKESAEKGNKIIVLIDDAYFGLVYEENIYPYSIFCLLADLHENVLAVKLDAPTKEDYVWGFRIGFITYGIKNGNYDIYQALEQKTAGAIRGSISNCSHLSQSLLLNAYNDSEYNNEKKKKYDKLKNRYNIVRKELNDHKEYKKYFNPMPFNSGYFMCINIIDEIDTEQLRKVLLTEFDTGIISQKNILRIAYSSVPDNLIPELFSNIYKACEKIYKK